MSTTTMKYSGLTLGTIEAVLNKLGGVEGVERFLSGELVVSVTQRVWKVWKTIQIGLDPKTVDDICADLKVAECFVSDWAKDLLGKKAYADSLVPEAMDAELVVVTVGELGFKNGATRKDIYDRAKELGLDLCPAQVGPALRKAYLDQPKGEWLLIAMEPITGSGGRLDVFLVGRHGGSKLYLSARSGHPAYKWHADNRWVFLRRK